MNKGKHLTYLSADFIQAVYNFEQVIDLLVNDPYQLSDYTVYQGQKETLTKTTFEPLKDGINKGTIIQFHIFRVIEHNQSTYLLVSETRNIVNSNKYYVLVVLCTSKNQQKWNKQVETCTRISVRELNIEGKINNDMVVCVTRVQNAILQVSKNKEAMPIEDIKKNSKALFHQKKFYEAFLLYEMGLSSHLKYSNPNSRAILYANSATCLFQMRAYESSIIYADVAIRIDREYPKSYAKKIFALLEINRYYEIPSLLANLQMKIHANQFEKIYRKYTTYLYNNIGQFNWKYFFSNPESYWQQCTFGQYHSPKLHKVEEEGSIKYEATESIEPFELLMIKKPIVFFKYEQIKSEKEAMTQIYRYMKLEKSLETAISNISRRFSQKDISDERDGEINIQEKEIEKIIYREKKNGDLSGHGMGIWKDLFLFSHKCQPNCSFLTTRNALLVSSAKRIAAGTPLTLDFACMDYPTQRRKSLYENFGIECDCRVCKWEEWPSNLGNIEEVAGLIGNIKNLKMLKQLMRTSEEKHSLFLNEKNCSKYDFDILARFLTIMQTNPFWEDLISLILLKKSKTHPEMQKILEVSITSGLVKFLKLSPEQCVPLIDKLL